MLLHLRGAHCTLNSLPATYTCRSREELDLHGISTCTSFSLTRFLRQLLYDIWLIIRFIRPLQLLRSVIFCAKSMKCPYVKYFAPWIKIHGCKYLELFPCNDQKSSLIWNALLFFNLHLFIYFYNINYFLCKYVSLVIIYINLLIQQDLFYDQQCKANVNFKSERNERYFIKNRSWHFEQFEFIYWNTH